MENNQENSSGDDNPFNSSTEEINVKEVENKEALDSRPKDVLSMDPSILRLNNKLLSDIKNLSIHEDGKDDPSYDILHIEDHSLMDESSIDDSNKTAYKDDMVYLSNIYDIFNKVNTKLDNMMDKMFVDKRIIRDIHKDALEENLSSIVKHTKNILSDEEAKEISLSSVKDILEEFPKVFKQIEDDLLEISKLKNEYETYIEKYLSISKNINKDVEDIKINIENKLRDFVLVFNGINSTYQIKLAKEENNKDNSGSPLGFDNVDSLFNSVVENFIKINNENNKLSEELDNLKTNRDINTMNKIIENNKKTIKKLQDENVSFSNAVNKLNEINIKLKKECVLISSEYKKLAETNKERKRTIEKQKRVIELLQSKLGENLTSPLEEIKYKMEKLKTEIAKEKDPEKKNNLIKNFEDTERRLKDFEHIYNKK
ncbi:hypothetical protein NGRA_1342 [Nosema granulosis]|uniref:Uncharacterized protein n=1 Tax=Nosema granulosis TaxID=83296 RepID=A0A9P6H1C6_9MICR|nr:hypothetical protein NGRA_1342 [Nosema granulosis]